MSVATSTTSFVEDPNHEMDLAHLCTSNALPLSKKVFGQNPEAVLRETAQESVTHLVHAIFRLPSERVDVGRVAVLPAPVAHLPREKPLPRPKPETRWEKFAKTKGIEKRKRSRMVWDEAKQEYAPRYGYGRANEEGDVWAIEHKGGAEEAEEGGAVVDPWTQLERERKERIAKNKKKQDRNLAEASGRRLPGTIDLASTYDVKPGKRNQQGKPIKRKDHVDVALSTAQLSTASMGKFDNGLRGEPEVKKAAKAKRDFRGDLGAEKAAHLKLLSSIVGNDEGDGGFDADAAADREMAGQKRAQQKAKGGRGKRRKTKQ